eukprot:365603-Chlamydomonas_euryale.AAC.14
MGASRCAVCFGRSEGSSGRDAPAATRGQIGGPLRERAPWMRFASAWDGRGALCPALRPRRARGDQPSFASRPTSRIAGTGPSTMLRGPGWT